MRMLRFSAVALLFLVGISSIILSIVIVFSPLPQLREEEARVKKVFDTVRDDANKLVFIGKRGDDLRKLISERSIYDRKIDAVLEKMPSDVQIEGMTFKSKTYTFIFTSSNLESLNNTLDIIGGITGKGQEFTRIYLTSITADVGKKKFEMIVDLLSV